MLMEAFAYADTQVAFRWLSRILKTISIINDEVWTVIIRRD